MGALKLVFHYAAFNEFRKQPVVAAELDRLGHLVAEEAGGEPDFAVVSELTGSRAKTVVITATPAAMKAEATDQVLTRALGAARG